MDSSTRVGAGVRTRVRIPLTFADGYATAAGRSPSTG